MATDKQSSDYAVTININPESFVSIPVSGRMLRKKWSAHEVSDQLYFLNNFLMLLTREGLSPKDWLVRFEDTQKGCKHLHMTVTTSLHVLNSAKENFCVLISKKMPEEIKNRCVLIKKTFDVDRWNQYVKKQDPRDEVSDDEPIEVPKLPRYNIMRRHHLKK